VAAAGDVNGDGLADVIVNVEGDAAGARVVFGRASSSPINSNALQGGGFAIFKTGPGQAISVAGAGDVNGDGLDDLLMGVSGASANGNANAGQAFVVFGKASNAPVQLSSLQGGQPGGFVIDGARAGDFAGANVNAAGDVNRDGLSDVVVGAPNSPSNGNTGAGRVYVVFGKRSNTSVQLSTIEAGAGGGFAINGVNSGDAAGGSVAPAGDMNIDGNDDVLIGAPLASPGGAQSAGTSYVVFGKTDSSPVALLGLHSGQRGGFAVVGVDSPDMSGTAVSSAGDFNGDGAADLIIGAALASPGGVEFAGTAYVVFGSALSQ
jgi:hypothetical protein